MRIAVGRAAMSGALSVPVAALMEGVLSTMWLTKLKTATAVAIMAGFMMTGVVALAVQAPDDKPDESVPAKRPQTEHGGFRDSQVDGRAPTPRSTMSATSSDLVRSKLRISIMQT